LIKIQKSFLCLFFSLSTVHLYLKSISSKNIQTISLDTLWSRLYKPRTVLFCWYLTPSPLPPLFLAFYSKYLEATQTWQFLTLQNFLLRMPLWKFKKIALLPLRAFWNIGSPIEEGLSVVCTKGFDPLYVGSCYFKRVKTSWIRGTKWGRVYPLNFLSYTVVIYP